MTDGYGNERIRRGLAMLVEDSPVAPDLEELTMPLIRPRETQRARPVLVAGLSAAVVLATFAVGGFWFGRSGGQSDAATVPAPTTTPSTLPALAPGEFPRVLLDAPGWELTFIEYGNAGSAGDDASSAIEFSDGSAQVSLFMRTGSRTDLQQDIDEWMDRGNRLEGAPVWGVSATVIKMVTDHTAIVAFWESNGVVYEFSAVYEFSDPPQEEVEDTRFRSLLGSLIRVPEEEWIRRLPDEFVTDRAQAMTTYLIDVPLPPGFDITELEEGPIEHWRQVASDAVNTVSCGWIESWIDAKASGDTEAAQRAVDAMASSRHWKVIDEMYGESAHPEEIYPFVWEYADAMAGDGTMSGGYEDGSRLTVEDGYRTTFSCDG